MLTQNVFIGVDLKFKWAFLGTNGDYVFSERKPRWNEAAGCYPILQRDEICPVDYEDESYIPPTRQTIYSSLLKRAEQLPQTVFDGIDGKFKWAWLALDGHPMFCTDRPEWSQNTACYVVRRGDCPESTMFERAPPVQRSVEELRTSLVERFEQVVMVPGQEVFQNYGSDWKWAALEDNGQLYLCDVKPVFSGTGWRAENGSWERVPGAVYPEAVSGDVWKTWLLERCDAPTLGAKLAPLELAKLYLQDARHNAAVMVDDGRLTIDQFNEIFSEQ